MKKEYEVTPEQDKEIKKLLGINIGLWKPEEDEWYNFIDDIGIVNSGTTYENNNSNDIRRIEMGNYFQNIEEAQKALDKLKAIQKVKEYIADNFGVVTVDKNDCQKLFTINYVRGVNEFIYEHNSTALVYSPFGYLKSFEDSELLIKDCEEELKIIFDVK